MEKLDDIVQKIDLFKRDLNYVDGFAAALPDDFCEARSNLRKWVNAQREHLNNLKEMVEKGLE